MSFFKAVDFPIDYKEVFNRVVAEIKETLYVVNTKADIYEYKPYYEDEDDTWVEESQLEFRCRFKLDIEEDIMLYKDDFKGVIAQLKHCSYLALQDICEEDEELFDAENFDDIYIIFFRSLFFDEIYEDFDVNDLDTVSYLINHQ